jgi:hypothetical protein
MFFLCNLLLILLSNQSEDERQPAIKKTVHSVSYILLSLPNELESM